MGYDVCFYIFIRASHDFLLCRLSFVDVLIQKRAWRLYGGRRVSADFEWTCDVRAESLDVLIL